jgi:hypothetical protein
VKVGQTIGVRRLPTFLDARRGIPLDTDGLPHVFLAHKEAASIKPANPDRTGTMVGFLPGGGLRVNNATLKDMIETAYQVRSFQILGGPAWAGSARYDVTAKSGQLQSHRETRELPVYSLVVNKSGVKPEGLRMTDNRQRGINARAGAMTGEAATMANLALVLARQLGRPVVNDTGLDGNYNFELLWTPDLSPAAPGDQAVADSSGPSLFTALREQLGLRLEAGKGPVEVIVIDRAEKPSED